MRKVTNVRKYQKENVYEAFNKRLDYICNYFDHLIVSFSGGKDSGLMLELVHRYYEENKLADREIAVSVYYLDYEGNYQETKDYIERSMGKYPDFDYYHICMPVSASCGISMSQSTWLPWDPEHPELWLNSVPEGAIHLENHNFPFFEIGMSDYDFQSKFCQWLHQEKKAERTAVLVGIRAQESLNRFNAVTRDETFSRFGTTNYSHRIFHNVFNFYPMYDWLFEDVWVANAKFSFDYNHLYDLYFQAGVPFKSMRVANPFHQCGVSSLKLYQALEPETWGKLIGRVNGANFAAIYGGTIALGYRGVSLPKGHTWETYVDFLLKTLPEDIREVYLKKFQSSLTYWTKNGGALPQKVVSELEETNLQFENLGTPKNNRNYKQEYELVRFKKYPDDVPIKNFRLVPSYKRMCVTILKNDTSCQYMGFGQTKDELQKKKEAMKKWESFL
ncbi:MAG: phosphoadenosine phosphosulfate reductase [Lactococcus lactis]|nr:phosphoadenosine phosphosulfate reductase [Lactococcus lactis]MDN6031952.1 phosphoadenosine phosphosulfate reductase [Lactococcus lactis]MDN6101136.1 phosphoadenosine phosphosulfate reductase [Lactococcus lactis]MDN6420784.1 phosphoadenosine phosphosulfate reductase [Lactococcus lactis]MDN6506123.1 phosphoadenosine phosphosulfate reductase [Lactococcus lactis]